MAILFTSFTELAKQPSDSPWHFMKAQAYSVARFQPQGFALDELQFLSATGAKGEKLLLRHFSDPLVGYANSLRAGYTKRWKEIKQWLESLDPDKDIVLCCWCPHSSQTRKQVRVHGSFCCHTGLIAKMIKKHRPDIELVFDDERKKYLHPMWKPTV